MSDTIFTALSQAPTLTLMKQPPETSLEELLNILFRGLHNLMPGEYKEIKHSFRRGFSLNAEGVPVADVSEPSSEIVKKDSIVVKFIRYGHHETFFFMNQIFEKMSERAEQGLLAKGLSPIEAKKLGFVVSMTFSINENLETAIQDVKYFTPEIAQS